VALHRFFRNKVGDDFEELVQRTLARCVEGQERFEGRSAFRSYLFGVAYNVLREHLRERSSDRERRLSDDASVADLDQPGPSTALGARREQRLLLEGLRRLPLNEQVLLELFYWEQMPSPEIGAVFGVPAPTVRSRLRLARERLLGHLDELARNPDELKSTTDDLDRWAGELREQFRRDAQSG